MKLEDIDHLFDIMVAEAAEKGDDGLLPGAVILSADSYCRLPNEATSCPKILEGIRYRDIRVKVARDYVDQVLNRAEAGERGEPFKDLAPKA